MHGPPSERAARQGSPHRKQHHHGPHNIDDARTGQQAVAHRELIAARRGVALGKIDAFNFHCWRLAELVQAGVVSKVDAVDALAEADTANDLSVTFGGDLVQRLMSDAFTPANSEANA